MMTSSSLNEYKEFVTSYLREWEIQNCKGDQQKLERLDEVSDDDLLRKWLWIGSIIGSLVFFLALPFLCNILARFIPYLLMEILWTVLKAGMGLVVIIFGLAIYLTVYKSQQD